MPATKVALQVRNNNGLSNDEIRTHCPAIFAEDKHSSRTRRYTYIPTMQILDRLRDEGFIPTFAMQSSSRVEGKQEFTKHLVRMRDIRANTTQLHEEWPEVVLVNAHDGTSSYQLMQGLFRCVCTNGLITGSIYQDIRIPHNGNIADRVVEGTLTVIEETQETVASMERMKQIEVPPQFQLLLAEFATSLRFAKTTPTLPAETHMGDALHSPSSLTVVANPGYTAADFLRTRRREDRGDDLWRVFNRVQENLIKGGARHYDEQGKKHTLRGIKGIDETIKDNKLLWEFTQRMAQMLG